MRSPIRSLLLASLLAHLACGGAIASPDSADAGSGSDASNDASTTIDGASIAACVAESPPDPPPAKGQCVMPSGRLCAGNCTCDDGCNDCACSDNGGYISTLELCPEPPGPVIACDAKDRTTSCRAVPTSDVDCAGDHSARGYYCNAAVLAQCGAGACPDAACVLHRRDDEGGSYWCCD